MPAAAKPITGAIEDRFIQLVSLGASYADAARAVQIGERSADRIASPRNAEIRAARAGTASDETAAVREAMRGLLESENPEVRLAAETVRVRYPESFQALETDDPFSTPPPSGCVRFPHPDYEKEDE